MQTAEIYAKALCELSMTPKAFAEVEQIIHAEPRVLQVLENPTIPKTEKHRLIEKLFPKETRSFLKLLCDRGKGGSLPGILRAFYREYQRRNHLLEVEVSSAFPLTEEERREAEAFVKEKNPNETCRIHYGICRELLGGMRIRIGNMEYDNSYQGRLQQLESCLIKRGEKI